MQSEANHTSSAPIGGDHATSTCAAGGAGAPPADGTPAALHTPETTSLIPCYRNDCVALYLGAAYDIMRHLPSASVDCIVTTPPSYAVWCAAEAGTPAPVPSHHQRLPHPQAYLDMLVAVFREAHRLMKPSGSLWVHLMDAYWPEPGEGREHSHESRGDHTDSGIQAPPDEPLSWCSPGQLLLLPHRLAIALQEIGWIVRNDNILALDPPASSSDCGSGSERERAGRDRCALTHSYMFHCVRRKRYYYDMSAVAVPSRGKRPTKPPPTVWLVGATGTPAPARMLQPGSDTGLTGDRLRYEVVRLPICATCPPHGLLLDPFCGNSAAIEAVQQFGGGRNAIGIDSNASAIAALCASLTSRVSGAPHSNAAHAGPSEATGATDVNTRAVVPSSR